MTVFVALMRAVNVGGTGKLAMADLRAICTDLGFGDARTFIASGNALFTSDRSEAEVKAMLEARLSEHMGRPAGVFVRSASELAAIVESNPFPDAHGSRHMVFFYDVPPPADLIAQCRDPQGERLALGSRELHVDYGEGIRHSKLKIPGKDARTARSMNSVRKLAALAVQPPR
jgi:uncharacterized protein (DUF1697 family)